MYRPIKWLMAIVASTMFLAPMYVHATVIDFEDLTTRDNFTSLGIVDSYQGYEWGYGTGAGVGARTFVNNLTGWASATTTDTAVFPAPSGVGGTSYAWNWNGPQSLWIDFRAATDMTSIDLATLSPNYSSNASFIQLFGYDAADNLLATSGILNLTDTFQTLNTGFSDIHYLELRANANSQWFSIDNLVVNEGAIAVSSPGSLALISLGLVGLALRRRRTNKS